mmetsp:Transcript_4231/g.7531  ORF Transcript_4231/g.7531 Transcript_4231/m.7531 type:complete len:429 (+) Transcript_4231:873-2159(+)
MMTIFPSHHLMAKRIHHHLRRRLIIARIIAIAIIIIIIIIMQVAITQDLLHTVVNVPEIMARLTVIRTAARNSGSPRRTEALKCRHHLRHTEITTVEGTAARSPNPHTAPRIVSAATSITSPSSGRHRTFILEVRQAVRLQLPVSLRTVPVTPAARQVTAPCHGWVVVAVPPPLLLLRVVVTWREATPVQRCTLIHGTDLHLDPHHRTRVHSNSHTARSTPLLHPFLPNILHHHHHHPLLLPPLLNTHPLSLNTPTPPNPPTHRRNTPLQLSPSPPRMHLHRRQREEWRPCPQRRTLSHPVPPIALRRSHLTPPRLRPLPLIPNSRVLNSQQCRKRSRHTTMVWGGGPSMDCRKESLRLPHKRHKPRLPMRRRTASLKLPYKLRYQIRTMYLHLRVRRPCIMSSRNSSSRNNSHNSNHLRTRWDRAAM